MTGLLPALFGALIVVGLLGVVIASRPHTPQPRPERTPSAARQATGLGSRRGPGWCCSARWVSVGCWRC